MGVIMFLMWMVLVVPFQAAWKMNLQWIWWTRRDSNPHQ